ncbi:MAG: MFS transporter, partial [Chloroflexi bacterium]
TAGLLGVVFGLIEGQRYDWGAVTGGVTIPEIIGAGVAVLAAFFVHQALRQDREPLLPFKVFKDRNFSLMTVVMAGMGFAILGAFLPLTIYLQSVLGLSAIQAGLTIAPQPVAMMIASSIAAPLSQKMNGKYLLIPGLVLFAAGLGYIDWTVQAGADRWALLPGLIVSGVGLGCIWLPLFSLATRDLEPELAGVASGVMNTIQELGTVVASAAVGALLQNQLATDLHSQAVKYSAQLPPTARDGFVSGFSHTVGRGLEVGVSQAGSGLGLAVFTHAFVDAMRISMLLPIAVIVAAAIVTFGVRAGRAQATEAGREAA